MDPWGNMDPCMKICWWRNCYSPWWKKGASNVTLGTPFTLWTQKFSVQPLLFTRKSTILWKTKDFFWQFWALYKPVNVKIGVVNLFGVIKPWLYHNKYIIWSVKYCCKWLFWRSLGEWSVLSSQTGTPGVWGNMDPLCKHGYWNERKWSFGIFM